MYKRHMDVDIQIVYILSFFVECSSCVSTIITLTFVEVWYEQSFDSVNLNELNLESVTHI